MSKPRNAIAIVRQRPARGSMTLLAFALVGALTSTLLVSAAVSAQEWTKQEVAPGTKPALSLSPDGEPVIVYMLEREDGWVRVASLADSGWQIDEIATGYFYGPPDIVVGPDGVAHATYHDHQDQTFRPEKGDAVYVRGEDGAWSVTAAADAGHDGWDNRITVDRDGRPHMVAIDPVEFNGPGVEYYSRLDDGDWSVEQVGSGPQTYKYAVSVAIDSDGVPWVSYHDGAAKTLNLAHRTPDGWQNAVVDDEGDTGFFNESVIDADDGLHLSYYQQLDPTSGVVKHAYRAPGSDEWQISTVDSLGAVSLGFPSDRNITSIDVDADGNPWIVYSDESILKLARQVGQEWQTEVVAEAGDVPFGQIVSLELDAEDRPHIAFAEVTDKRLLDGSIWYATRG